MDFLEFICGLFEALDLIELLSEIIPKLVRAIYRGGRWLFAPSGEPWGRLDVRERKSRFPDERGMLHLSLTRRRRGKWRGGSYVLR